jgi:hypothetical protein
VGSDSPPFTPSTSIEVEAVALRALSRPWVVRLRL